MNKTTFSPIFFQEKRHFFFSVFLLFFLLACSQSGKDLVAPSDLAVSPASPGFDRTPTISGRTSSKVEVRLYRNPNCEGSFLGDAHADESGAFSLTSSKLGEGLYEFSVLAVDGDAKKCSSSFVSYVLSFNRPRVALSGPSASAVNSAHPGVQFTATYTDADTIHLTAADITLNKTGTANCNGVVVTNGTTATATITLSQCSGDGTVGISLAAGTAEDDAGNKVGFSRSGSFAVDNTAMSAATFAPSNGTYEAIPATVLVTFSEPINASTLTAADFSVSGTCTTLPTVSISATAGAVTALQLSGGNCTSAPQTVILTANLVGIQDAAGNAGTGSPSVTYSIDQVGPTSSTFNPATATLGSIPTSVVVTFNENVDAASVSVADFPITGTCTTKPTASISNISGAVVTVGLAGASCSNNQTVIITAQRSGIDDTLGNAGSGTSSATYTLDSVGPAVQTITPVSATVSTLPTSVSLSFNEAVLASSVAGSDLIVSGTCGALPIATVSSVSGTTVTFALTGGSCVTGQIVSVSLAGSSITDARSNAGTGAVSAVYTYDNSPPSPISVTPSSGAVNAPPTSVSFQFTENIRSTSVAASDLVIIGSCSTLPTASVAGVSNSLVSFNLSGANCAHGQTLTVTLNGSSVTDLGNTAGVSSINATYTIESVGPTPSSISPATGTRLSMPTSVTVNFDENVLSSSVTSTDLNISGTCASLPTASVSSVSGSSVVFSLTSTTCSHGGTLILSVSGSNFTDSLGNAGSNSQSVTYTLDSSAPTLSSMTPVTGTYTSIPFTVTATFNENIDASSVSTADLSISGTCSSLPTASISSVSGSIIEIGLGGGSCSNGQTTALSLNRGGVSDVAGNFGSGTSTVTYTVDNAGPTVSSFSPASGQVPSSVDIYFSESLASGSVSASDFSLSGSCWRPPTLSIATVSGNRVTLNLNGANCRWGETLGITINASSVTDIYGNPGTGTSQVIFTD